MSLNQSIIHVLRLPSTTLISSTRRLKLRPSAAAAAVDDHHDHLHTIRRRSANYKPTAWNHEFLQSFKVNEIIHHYQDKVVVMLEKELEASEIMNEEDVLNMLELIDDIQRLGLSHRFENAIRKALDRFLFIGGSKAVTDKSIYCVALGFKLLRQNGYHVSQGTYSSSWQLVNDKGVFEGDVKDMLSLYEASYIAYEGEDMLDMAMEQTTSYLNNFLLHTNSGTTTSSSMKEVVRHSLEIPLHRRAEILETRWYIEAYKKRKDANLALVQLATLEFNWAQSVLQADLKDASKWWNSLGLAKELSFSRDRLVECFLWGAGTIFQPQLSSCRKSLTKVTSFVTTIDDIYDVYGTLDELQLFTHAVDRWDINAVDTLPDYMKLCFLAFYNTVNDMAYEALRTHGHNILPYLTKSWADLLKAFLKEAEWSHSDNPPTFLEYVENAWRSVSGTVILVHAYCLLNEDVHLSSFSKETLDDLMNYDRILRWPSVIFRLCNDLATSPEEIARGETVNAISCYMNENGVSEEKARKHLKSMIDQAWKNMNQELLDDQKSGSEFAKSYRKSAINLARITYYSYSRGDSHGNPDAESNETIFSLFFQPIVNIGTNDSGLVSAAHELNGLDRS
ncbi:Probable terpene synthase 12 [Linum grandiflorum]